MALAQICWVPEKEGGREVPFTGHRYVTVARFDGDNTWPNEAWSLVVEFTEPATNSRCATADIGFLVPEAPTHLLVVGKRFELYEGPRCVARGEIVADHADQRKTDESLIA
jgi:hypothetical protein